MNTARQGERQRTSPHRISRSSDFTRTLSTGVRVPTRDLVVHVADLPTDWPDDSGRRRDVATTGGPWLGLIVSKAVGPAVIRHRLARRIRAAFAEVMHLCPSAETTVVVRARPSAADRSSTDIAAQLSEALAHPRVHRATAAPVGS